MTFTPPVDFVSFFVLDFDANLDDPLDVIAYDAFGEVERVTILSAGDPAGDGAAQEVQLSASGIRRVVVNFGAGSAFPLLGTHDNGLAIDDLTFQEAFAQGDSWDTTKAPRPTAVATSTAGVIDEILYVVGGTTGSVAIDLVEAYNPVDDTWRPKPPFQRPGILLHQA